MSIQELYEGLQELAGDAFPKRCAACGHVFHNREAFLAETESLRNASGLKEGADDDDTPLVELFRNCSCGSTMLEFFGDRRDSSARGLDRRQRFGRLLTLLTDRGMNETVARRELIGVLNGRASDLLAAYGLTFRTR